MTTNNNLPRWATKDTYLKEQLESIGVQVQVQTFTGDSSFPVEYTLRYSFVEACGPTLDMAMSEFISALLKYVPVERA